MRCLLSLVLVACLLCNGCNTNNPQKDALAVCKCYNEITVNAGDDAVSAGLRKCAGLYADLAIKYKKNPSQLIEFVTLTDSCSKSK